MGTIVLAGNFWTILQALEEELEIQSGVAEALPLPGAFHCAEEGLHQGEGWPLGAGDALLQRWGWERAREGTTEPARGKG